MATQTKGTKWSEAYNAIKEDVLEGRYDPGERLEEAKLARALNMGRTPVREALRRLEVEGLLSTRGVNSHIHVHYLEEEDPQELLYRYEMRGAIESTAAALAAESMNAWQVEKLRQLEKTMGEALTAGNRALMHQANMEFHDYLVANCGNPLLYSAFKSYRLMPPEPRSAALEEQIQTVEFVDLVHQYTPLVDAIGARDPEEAERQMKVIISRITRSLRKVLHES
jgi:DNA-binding GntR family transcriptional regulator